MKNFIEFIKELVNLFKHVFSEAKKIAAEEKKTLESQPVDPAVKFPEPVEVRLPTPEEAAVKAEVKFKDDSTRLREEFKKLNTRNKQLKELVEDLALWIKTQFNKELIVTHVLRTNEEQDRIYAGTKRGSREYDKNPWISPHQVWTAVDLRTWFYTPEEIDKIVNYLNTKYKETNYYRTTAMYHEVFNSKGESHGTHFHIQYTRKG